MIYISDLYTYTYAYAFSNWKSIESNSFVDSFGLIYIERNILQLDVLLDRFMCIFKSFNSFDMAIFFLKTRIFTNDESATTYAQRTTARARARERVYVNAIKYM